MEAERAKERQHDSAKGPSDGVDYYNMLPEQFETELLKTSQKIQESRALWACCQALRWSNYDRFCYVQLEPVLAMQLQDGHVSL